jgi:hypothetical protein
VKKMANLVTENIVVRERDEGMEMEMEMGGRKKGGICVSSLEREEGSLYSQKRGWERECGEESQTDGSWSLKKILIFGSTLFYVNKIHYPVLFWHRSRS